MERQCMAVDGGRVYGNGWLQSKAKSLGGQVYRSSACHMEDVCRKGILVQAQWHVMA